MQDQAGATQRLACAWGHGRPTAKADFWQADGHATSRAVPRLVADKGCACSFVISDANVRHELQLEGCRTVRPMERLGALGPRRCGNPLLRHTSIAQHRLQLKPRRPADEPRDSRCARHEQTSRCENACRQSPPPHRHHASGQEPPRKADPQRMYRHAWPAPQRARWRYGTRRGTLAAEFRRCHRSAIP